MGLGRGQKCARLVLGDNLIPRDWEPICPACPWEGLRVSQTNGICGVHRAPRSSPGGPDPSARNGGDGLVFRKAVAPSHSFSNLNF